MLRVIAYLYEKNLHFQFVPINMINNRSQKKQLYLYLNPFDEVPALEDSDLKLFAITRYLAHETDGRGVKLIFPNSLKIADREPKLVFLEPKNIATLDVWMEVEAHQYDPVAVKLSWELAVKPAFGMIIDTGVVEEYKEQLSNILEVYEVRLAKSKYVYEDSFSLADLHHLPTMQYLMGTQAKKIFGSRPHVSAWCADILA